MTLAWPPALVALLAGPVLLALLWRWRRRRRRLVVRVSNVAVVRAAVPPRTAWRRRVPAALLIAGLVVLGVAAARPTARVTVARSSTSILLALDVSRSMCSTDVEPNRLVVAQEAARNFVRTRDDGTRVGLVAFAGFAGLVVPPTTDTGALLDALDRLTTARGTAIGMAILASIDAIAEYNPDVAPTGVALGADPGPPGAAGYEPDTIVVLTDGANTAGVEPIVAATEAAARRVRVYAIGFGTTEPSQPVCNIDQLGGELPDGPFDLGGGGGGGGGGGPGGGPPGRFLQLDEATLQAVADTTGGQYFRAADAAQLDDVFAQLPSEVVRQTEDLELTVWFVLVAAVLVAAAIGLSLWWQRAV